MCPFRIRNAFQDVQPLSAIMTRGSGSKRRPAWAIPDSDSDNAHELPKTRRRSWRRPASGGSGGSSSPDSFRVRKKGGGGSGCSGVRRPRAWQAEQSDDDGAVARGPMACSGVRCPRAWQAEQSGDESCHDALASPTACKLQQGPSSGTDGHITVDFSEDVLHYKIGLHKVHRSNLTRYEESGASEGRIRQVLGSECNCKRECFKGMRVEDATSVCAVWYTQMTFLERHSLLMCMLNPSLHHDDGAEAGQHRVVTYCFRGLATESVGKRIGQVHCRLCFWGSGVRCT